MGKAVAEGSALGRARRSHGGLFHTLAPFVTFLLSSEDFVSRQRKERESRASDKRGGTQPSDSPVDCYG